MMPVGYMAKHVSKRPDWLKAPQVVDIYSVSNCVSEDFADYINYWRHNGYWLFDSPEIIRAVAEENSIPLEETSLFYYEAYEVEFDGKRWLPYAPESSMTIDVAEPVRRQLEGFDVVTFFGRTSPEHSPLSCNGLADDLPTNDHCLLASFEEAETNINNGTFTKKGEPGPQHILAVYSLNWHSAR